MMGLALIGLLVMGSILGSILGFGIRGYGPMKVKMGPYRYRWVSYVHDRYMDNKYGRWEYDGYGVKRRKSDFMVWDEK